MRRARGRVLAADQTSRVDLPPFDKSAIDGYAILTGDERESYRLLGTVAAGQAGALTLSSGTTVKVMTGAPVPAGAARVVMQEQTEERDGVVSIVRRGGAVNICRMGEDVRRGDVILKAGARVEALEIANLVACGITELEVVRPVRLAIISTGNEIVGPPRRARARQDHRHQPPLARSTGRCPRARGGERRADWRRPGRDGAGDPGRRGRG